jgi:predicted transcriptional regulator
MKTLQIRLPKGLLNKIDNFIEKGLFKSRSQLLREALQKYISEFNYVGTLPYIIGPFSPAEIDLLQKAPKEPLEISISLQNNKYLKNI